MKKFKHKIVLLDAHAIIHRAYHAMPDFATRDGRPTGALYGISTMLISIATELKPDFVIACYDLPKPTFRHEAYDGYKSGRKKSDEDLVEQIKASQNIFKAFNIPIYAQAGYEADDIIGTFCEILKQDKNNQIIIASGDMDTFQLIDDDQVLVYTLKKGAETVLYNQRAVEEKYLFSPAQIVDYKGLAGDPSDNIPGISGIGAKTATNLILNFGGIDGIYQALAKGDDFFQKNFKEGKITPRLIKIIKEGEEEALFSRELARIKKDVPIEFALPKKKFLDNIDLAKTGEIFRQYEFRALNERLQKALGLADNLAEISRREISADQEKKVANLKLAVSLLNPNIPSPTLDDILNFGKNFKEAENKILAEIKKYKLNFIWEKIEIPLMPIVAEMTKNGFKIEVKKLKKLSQIFSQRVVEIEKEIYEIAGEKFNVKSTQQLSKILFQKLNLPTKGLKKTPKGVISTKESELQKLKGEHKIIDLILEHRELAKMLSTYVDNLILLVDKENKLHPEFLQLGTSTGRMSSKNPNIQNIPVGGEYGQKIREVFVAEENFSLVSFDYSQIELRVAAILSQDKKMIKAFQNNEDIHSAVAKEIFGEENPETRRKAKVINFGILYGMGATSLRKNLNEGSAEEISLVEAREYLDNYFKKFSDLAKFIEQTKREVQAKGYSTTLFGRKRFFPEINSKQPFIRAMAERMAVNAPIQGTATGDIVKLAMIKIDDFLQAKNLKSEVKILAQVHDELIYEIKDEKIKKITPRLTEIMEKILINSDLAEKYKTVPLKISQNIGKNWGKLK